MISMFRSESGILCGVDKFVPGGWICLTAPTPEELKQVSDLLAIDPDYFNAALDEEEIPRIEYDEQSLIIIDVPISEKTEEGQVVFSTLPLGMIITPDAVVTVCLKETSVIRDFTEGRVKNVHTNQKTRFILQICLRIATRFLQYLRQLDKISKYVEKQLHESMKNSELFQLLDLEKSLVYFSTSLKSNEIMLEKLMRSRAVKFFEEDRELSDDVLIEVRQAIDMANIYSSILSGTMDAFASIISNNLNIVMKVLTSLTILMTIPMIIFGFYGMNVTGLPMANSLFPIITSAVLVLVSFIVLKLRKLI